MVGWDVVGEDVVGLSVVGLVVGCNVPEISGHKVPTPKSSIISPKLLIPVGTCSKSNEY